MLLSKIQQYWTGRAEGYSEVNRHELATGQDQVYKIDFSALQKWYDGYTLNKLHIYNPKSVVDVIKRRRFKSYWTGTETYEALKIYIDMNFDGLKKAVIQMLGNGRYKINSRKFQNDMTTFHTRDDILCLLVHLGYLTYDEDTSEVFIPNQGIAQEFLNAVAEKIEIVHHETAFILKYNDENSLACTVLMAYYSAKAYYMNPIMEIYFYQKY